MNLADALVLKGISRVGDDSVTKILRFASAQGLPTLEELSKIGISKLPLKTVPLALKEFLEAQEFESARTTVEKDLETWRTQDIATIVLGSENYPKQLLGLDKPPPFLFCKGNLEILKHTSSIAVVGTRESTRKGEQIASKTVEEFAKRGYSIVSGLALGIDTIAHRAAIDCNTPTIAVLVDLISISPYSNRALADEILEKGGLWVAENPPGTKAIPAFFAKRDRIQAGLSTAVFAIETSINGGTMHAVNAALSMRRPVFVPNATAAGYSDLSIKAISGTQHLINDQKATSYTRESYAKIGAQLEQIASQFGSDIQEGLPL
jgi:DNA processing protein